VLRLDEPASLPGVIEALAKGGVRAIEVTLTTPGALEALAEHRATASDLVLGAGTVLDVMSARMAIAAGARFVVSPVFDRALVEMCHRYDVPAMPGAYTPTEILTAREAGADLIKLFPAGGLGPGYLRDLRGPMPGLRLVPTGGVTVENAAAFLQAGAVAVGVGGDLIERAAVAHGDWARVTERARRLQTAVRAARERAR
jgi:2-dehydro-3-deoxyphosphogluconate aldolase/(4S)-4-hydroxy-2-oxoglutarate aldolase